MTSSAPAPASELAAGRADGCIGSRPFRVETDRFVVIGDRLVIFALEIPGGAAIRKRLRKIRLEPQRLVIVLDGAIVFAGVVESVAAVCVAVGIFRLQPDRRFSASNAPQLAGLAKDFTAGAEGAGPVGIHGDDRVDLGQCLVGPAVAEQRNGAGNPGIKTVRVRRRRIVNDRGAAFDQPGGCGNRQGRANDRRVGERSAPAARETKAVTANTALAKNGRIRVA